MRKAISSYTDARKTAILRYTTAAADPRNVFETTPLWWDCACDDNFIHPASEPVCPRCRACRDDQPDSRVNEVRDLFGDVAV